MKNLTNVQKLQLQNNKLVLIEDGGLGRKESLKSNYLASNKLTTLSQETLIGVHKTLLLLFSEPCHANPNTSNCTREMC